MAVMLADFTINIKGFRYGSAETTSMTYSNSVSERRSLIDFSMKPILAAIEQRLSMPDFCPSTGEIRFSLDAMAKLWKTADKIGKPVVSGVYFISKENEGSLMKPFPVLFNDVSEYQIQYIHPLPDNEVIKIDNAGFGFVLMHKSIIPKLREANPGKGMFMETGDGDDEHEPVPGRPYRRPEHRHLSGAAGAEQRQLPPVPINGDRAVSTLD